MWPNFDGKPYTREQLAVRINACDFSNWKHKDGSHGRPAFITLHNTSSPDIKLWLSWSPAKRQQYMLNAQAYYEGLGWRGGPHFFVPPQNDICAFGFNDLMAAGTHASCFNNGSIGIEMVGEFDREAFDSGPGALVAENAIYLMALLHNKIGLMPSPYVYNQKGLHFHVECKADNHDCPGSFVRKPDILPRVQAKMAELAGAPPRSTRRSATRDWLSKQPPRRSLHCFRKRPSIAFATLRQRPLLLATSGRIVVLRRSDTSRVWQSSLGWSILNGKREIQSPPRWPWAIQGRMVETRWPGIMRGSTPLE